DTSILGKRLDAIAAARKKSPVEAALEIIVAGQDPGVASFNMNEKDVEKFMKADSMVTDSDGSDGHPRKYGTYPKLFHEYVNQKHVLTLERAVQRSSAQPAKILGLNDRGVIKQGAFADIIVFDNNTFADRSTYEQPTLSATDMRFVLANGFLTIDGGTSPGAAAGKALRRANAPGAEVRRLMGTPPPPLGT